jgi:bifunctional non-homologous end joining protein LigD
MSRKAIGDQLPSFVAPMLAQPGMPFDSDEHLFEIKWDGTRMLAYVDRNGYRLVNLHGHDRTEQYPEFTFLKHYPPGVILDGEVVVLVAGKPDFGKLLVREQTRASLKIRMLAHALPATYVAFDLLYARYESLMDQPLQRRRARLRQLLENRGQVGMVLSEGVVGEGRAFFERVCQERLEGVVAKRLDSCYRPGQRGRAWTKIKPAR